MARIPGPPRQRRNRTSHAARRQDGPPAKAGTVPFPTTGATHASTHLWTTPSLLRGCKNPATLR
eukprot:15333976-Heterocapsa_arctica.AAC.1